MSKATTLAGAVSDLLKAHPFTDRAQAAEALSVVAYILASRATYLPHGPGAHMHGYADRAAQALNAAQWFLEVEAAKARGRPEHEYAHREKDAIAAAKRAAG